MSAQPNHSSPQAFLKQPKGAVCALGTTSLFLRHDAAVEK
jgi:hypothetical protein